MAAHIQKNDSVDEEPVDLRIGHLKAGNEVQIRLLFSGAIIAGFIGYLQVYPMIERFHHQIANAVGITLGLSAVLSFLYL